MMRALLTDSTARAGAAAMLGPDAPLTRILGRLGEVVRQSAVTGALLVGSVVALIAGIHTAIDVAVAAAAYAGVLAVAACVLAQCRRDRLRDLIVAGRGNLPLAALRRERERLLDPTHRRCLADALETLPVRAGDAFSLYRRRVIATVASDILALATCLRDERVDPRGVALTERLVREPAVSPLYGDDAELLRQELRRIRHMLQAE
jgi:hypothetical protein